MTTNRYSQEWIHCNKCMEFTLQKTNEVLIGECGHFCCKKCLVNGRRNDVRIDEIVQLRNAEIFIMSKYNYFIFLAQNDVQSQNYCCAVCGSNDGIWCSLLGNVFSF